MKIIQNHLKRTLREAAEARAREQYARDLIAWGRDVQERAASIADRTLKDEAQRDWPWTPEVEEGWLTELLADRPAIGKRYTSLASGSNRVNRPLERLHSVECRIAEGVFVPPAGRRPRRPGRRAA